MTAQRCHGVVLLFVGIVFLKTRRHFAPVVCGRAEVGSQLSHVRGIGVCSCSVLRIFVKLHYLSHCRGNAAHVVVHLFPVGVLVGRAFPVERRILSPFRACQQRVYDRSARFVGKSSVRRCFVIAILYHVGIELHPCHDVVGSVLKVERTLC